MSVLFRLHGFKAADLVSGLKNIAVLAENINVRERFAGAEGDAIERVLGYERLDACFLPKHFIYPVQQRAAAGKINAGGVSSSTERTVSLMLSS